jgi:hypothetical protein
LGLKYAEALTAGLLSALCFERLRDVLKGSARVASLDAGLLGENDADVSYLLTTLGRFESPTRLLELVGDVPVRVVLACATAQGGEEIVRIGSGLSRAEAAGRALVGLVGTLQDRAAGPAADTPSYPSEIPFPRFSLPPDADFEPLERARYDDPTADVAEVFDLLRSGGRDVLFVNTTPNDVWSTETFITATVLLAG